jgi:hypothetical protein
LPVVATPARNKSTMPDAGVGLLKPTARNATGSIETCFGSFLVCSPSIKSHLDVKCDAVIAANGDAYAERDQLFRFYVKCLWSQSRLRNLAERFHDLWSAAAWLRKCALKTFVVSGQSSYMDISRSLCRLEILQFPTLSALISINQCPQPRPWRIDTNQIVRKAPELRCSCATLSLAGC